MSLVDTPPRHHLSTAFADADADNREEEADDYQKHQRGDGDGDVDGDGDGLYKYDHHHDVHFADEDAVDTNINTGINRDDSKDAGIDAIMQGSGVDIHMGRNITRTCSTDTDIANNNGLITGKDTRTWSTTDINSNINPGHHNGEDNWLTSDLVAARNQDTFLSMVSDPKNEMNHHHNHDENKENQCSIPHVTSTNASQNQNQANIHELAIAHSNANANANAIGIRDDNDMGLLDHNMVEATKMIREVEQCLDDLHRVQIQNAILMDSLVMVGADF